MQEAISLLAYKIELCSQYVFFSKQLSIGNVNKLFRLSSHIASFYLSIEKMC